MEIVRRMDMSYSYKPVLVKAVFHCADNKGRVQLSAIVEYFRNFYESRRLAGLPVEKANSIFAKGEYSNNDAERNIILNPFKRFEDMQMLRHAKTLGVVQIDEIVWKRLTDAEKEEIDAVCNAKLEAYFQKLS